MTDKEYPCDGCAFDHNCEKRKKVDCCDFCKWCYNGDSPCNFCKKNMMTNEEWLRTATTEQLAEEIVNMTLLDKYKLYDQMESAEYEHGIGIGAKKVIVEWLKQPHKE